MHCNTCRFDTGAVPVKTKYFNQYKLKMKREKLSLSGIKNALSRAELKNIMAGSGPGGGGGGGSCAGPGQSCGFIMGVPGNPSCCPGLNCYFNAGGYNTCN